MGQRRAVWRWMVGLAVVAGFSVPSSASGGESPLPAGVRQVVTFEHAELGTWHTVTLGAEGPSVLLADAELAALSGAAQAPFGPIAESMVTAYVDVEGTGHVVQTASWATEHPVSLAERHIEAVQALEVLFPPAGSHGPTAGAAPGSFRFPAVSAGDDNLVTSWVDDCGRNHVVTTAPGPNETTEQTVERHVLKVKTLQAAFPPPSDD